MKHIGFIFCCVSILFILPVTKAFSQAWQPVGEGLQSGEMAYCIDGVNLYVAYADSSNPAKKLHVSVWNGSFWSDLPVIVTSSTSHHIYKLLVYSNELYVIGDFDSIVNIPASRDIIRYNGHSWKNAGGGINVSSFSLLQSGTQIFNNKLYISGINKAGGMNVNHIACWDGNTWSKLGSPVDGTNGNINSIAVFDNKLYVAGSFSTAGNMTASNVACWNGTTWSALSSGGYQGTNAAISGILTTNNMLVVYGSFIKAGNIYTNAIAGWDTSYWHNMTQNLKSPYFFGTYSNVIFAIGKDPDSNFYRFQTWNGSTWSTQQKDTFDYFSCQSFVTSGNKKWLVGKFKYHKNPSYYDLINYNGSLWIPFTGKVPGSSASLQRNLIDYNGTLMLAGTFAQLSHLTLNNIARLDYSVSGRVEGLIYYDKNEDCFKDAGENGISSMSVKIEPGDYELTTNSQGKFGGYIDTGFKTITLLRHSDQYKYWQLSPCNPLDYYLFVRDTVSYMNNVFAVYPVNFIRDLKVSVTCQSGFKARKGYNERYYIKYENIGTALIGSGSLSCNIDSRMTYINSMPLFNSATGNTYSWDFYNLQPAEARTVMVTLNIDSTHLNLGDTVHFYCSVLPLDGDSDITNNYDTLFQKIVSSVDPNDKQCSPEGDILATTAAINYIIRFQNTGSDTAIRVVVIDTIETNHLPLTEIEMKTSSHPYTLNVVNNVLIWAFNNINLPDSNIDEAGSQGYIRYSADLLPGLAAGTKIQNQAYIYFDYMHYVPSNKTLNTIVDKTGIDGHFPLPGKSLVIYPNPANNKLFIQSNSMKVPYSDMNLYDVLGRKIINFRIYKNQTTILDISNLGSGIYLVKSPDGMEVEKVIIK